MLPGAGAAAPALPALPRDYVALLKPRVMSLVLFTALIGLVAAPGRIDPVLAGAALVLVALGAGASGALNMWYDADIDRRMKRTRARPIPAGRLSRADALGFGLTLAVASVVAMALLVNLASATLLAITIAFYVVVYTMWLKRRTAQNIVIGGAAGAFPPMIGYAAVTGTVTIESLVLFAIIFFWTPPHFWALSLFCAKDYDAASVPMLPSVAGERATRNQILIYSLLLAPIALTPALLGHAGVIYGISAIGLDLVFLGLAYRVWRGVQGAERRLFAFSILYLFLLFAILGLESLSGVGDLL
ncbi:MAG: heme o synthase [Rhodothalassiaceae bacterium]